MHIDLTAPWQTLQGMINGFLAKLPEIVLALIIFSIFYFFAKSIKTLLGNVIAQRQRGRYVGLVLGRLAQAFVVVAGLLISLTVVFPTLKAEDLVQLLGISGIAVGFAFRDILQNFLAGILLLLTRPFEIGDQIVVDEFEGTVEDIQTRATTMRTYDGRRIVIPNADLFTKSVTVNTAFDNRRVEYDVGIGNGDDIERAKARTLEAVGSVHEVLQDPPPEVLVYAFGDYSVTLRVRWWIRPPR